MRFRGRCVYTVAYQGGLGGSKLKNLDSKTCVYTLAYQESLSRAYQGGSSAKSICQFNCDQLLNRINLTALLCIVKTRGADAQLELFFLNDAITISNGQSFGHGLNQCVIFNTMTFQEIFSLYQGPTLFLLITGLGQLGQIERDQ